MEFDKDLPLHNVLCIDTTRMPIGSCIQLDYYEENKHINTRVGIVRHIEDNLQEFTFLSIDENQNEEEDRITIGYLFQPQTNTGYKMKILGIPSH